eukprot:6375889-Prymnesium_polylepis.1
MPVHITGVGLAHTSLVLVVQDDLSHTPPRQLDSRFLFPLLVVCVDDIRPHERIHGRELMAFPHPSNGVILVCSAIERHPVQEDW